MSQIRGLAQFIADVRAAQTAETEKQRVFTEISNLRKKTRKNARMNAYELRKTVSKLLFIHLLGYEAEFGDSQITQLFEFESFPEKNVAYLAMALLPQKPATLPDVLESDLRSPHEFLTSLALNYISADPELASGYQNLVYQLAVSPTSSVAVAKKACLTLAMLIRERKLNIEDVEMKIKRLAAMLDTASIGLATSLAALLFTVLEGGVVRGSVMVSSIFPRAVAKLQAVLADCDPQYKYGGVAAPWLCSKLLDVLAILPSSITASTRSMAETEELKIPMISEMPDVLDMISEILSMCSEDKSSSSLIVLVSLARVISEHHLQTGQIEIQKSALQLVNGKQETLKLIGLQLLELVGQTSSTLCMQLRPLLKDKDAAVRTQTLTVLCKMATVDVVEHIAADVLDLLVYAELQQRPKMASAVAGLAERFAYRHEFYLDTCLALLTTGSGDALWQQIYEVVLKNEELQPYAIKRCCESLAFSQPSAGLVCLAACLVGNFSHLYQGDPLDLVAQLEDAREFASVLGKAMLATAYTQLAAKHTETRPSIADLMEVYSTDSNLETQQRAQECLMLLRPENEHLLSLVPLSAGVSKPPQPQQPPHLRPQLTMRRSVLEPVTESPLEPAIKSDKSSKTLSSNWEFGFKRMLTQPSAVLYQDALLQVGCRYAFVNNSGKVTLYLKNISTFDLSAVTLDVHSSMPKQVFEIECESSLNILTPQDVQTAVIKCTAHQPFAQPPTLRITYLAGSLGEIHVKLPTTLERFMTPSLITLDEFALRWQQLESMEFEKTFVNCSASKSMKTVDNDLAVVTGLQYALVYAEKNRTLAAGIIHTDQPAGALLELLKNGDSYVLKIRSTHKLVSVVLANSFAQAYTL